MNSLDDSQSKIQTADNSCHHHNPPRDRAATEARAARRSRDPGRDVETRNRVVQAHMGLVYRVARQFLHRGLTIEDLVGEGNLGLIRAAQEYDPALGTRFSTYATYWIRDAIQTALANTGATIRLPVNVSKLLVRWRRTEKLLSQRQGHPPTFEEVATAMGLDQPAQRLIEKARRVARLQQEAGTCAEGAPRTLPLLDEGMTAEESLAHREERESVPRRLERLGVTERTVVLLKFGLSGEPPLTFGQIGVRLGIPTTAVHRIAASAMRKLGGQPAPRHDHSRHDFGSRVG